MKKILLIVKIISILSVTAFLFNCQPAVTSDSTASNLPVKTIKFQDDGASFIQFYTNDSQYYNMAYLGILGINYDLMVSVEIQVKKISGKNTEGYGIVFCVKDINNFYLILIDCTGYFALAKKSGGTYSTLQYWTASAYLKQGYGVINTIKVTRSSNSFSLYFNNNFVGNISDNTFTGGNCGYYAGIGASTSESFPNTPVDVRFKFVSGTASSVSPYSAVSKQAVETDQKYSGAAWEGIESTGSNLKN